MDYSLPLLPFLAIVGVAAIGWFATHKQTATKLETIVETRFAQLKQHLEANPTVQAIEAKVEPAFQASLDDLHAKVDAIREKLGGVYTEVEKSAIVQDLSTKLAAAESAVLALSSIAHDAQVLRNAFAGTNTSPAASAPAPATTAGAVGGPADGAAA